MKTILFQGRLLWPKKRAYRVTTWWSDGNITKHWEHAYGIPAPLTLRI